jgi:hypothetical protein
METMDLRKVAFQKNRLTLKQEKLRKEAKNEMSTRKTEEANIVLIVQVEWLRRQGPIARFGITLCVYLGFQYAMDE